MEEARWFSSKESADAWLSGRIQTLGYDDSFGAAEVLTEAEYTAMLLARV